MQRLHSTWSSPLFSKAVSGLGAEHCVCVLAKAALWSSGAVELWSCVFCQSVRMNLSLLLTDADAQRKRTGAGKTRFSFCFQSHACWRACAHKLTLDLPLIGVPEFRGLFGSELKGLSGFMDF